MEKTELTLKAKDELLTYPDLPVTTNHWDRLLLELKEMILSQVEAEEIRGAQNYWKVS